MKWASRGVLRFAVAPVTRTSRLRLGIDGLNMPLWRPVLREGHAFPTAGKHGTRPVVDLRRQEPKP